MHEQVKQALRSVVAINVTPFDAHDRIDETAYTAVVERLVDGGAGIVTPNGNTGEFYSLTTRELETSVDLTVAAVAGRVPVVSGIGYELDRAVRLARAAERAGAQGVMVHQPVHPYQSEAGWVDYHRRIADAVPGLAIVAYVRSPHVTAAAFRELAAACPNVVGVKYAVPDVLAFGGIVTELGRERLTWVCGLAESWAPFYWVAGAEGFTSGLVNVVPEVAQQLLARLRAGDLAGAMQVWARVKPLEDMRARRGNADNVAVVKEALAQLGLCSRAVRPPSSVLGKAERTEIATYLQPLSIPAAAEYI
jgi:4-hydroxy-tetrahydrodipicolinate synthase